MSSHGPMVIATRETLSRTISKARGRIGGAMVVNTSACGKITRCMGMEH